MKANLIKTLITLQNQSVHSLSPEIIADSAELDKLGFVDGLGLTESGRNLIIFLETSSEYFITHREIKENANILVDKAKNKFNSILDMLKIN